MGSEAIEIDKVTAESLTVQPENVYHKTFKEQFTRRYKPEKENLDDASRTIYFEIPGMPEKAYRPTGLILRLPVRIYTAGAAGAFSDPAAADHTGPTHHARFKNLAGIHIVKQVKILPSNGADLNNMNPNLTAIEVTMRYYLQFNEEEKKDNTFLRSKFCSYALMESGTPTMVGMDNDVVAGNRAAEDALEIEQLTWGRWHTLELKLLGGWSENGSLIPSTFSFRIEITLATDLER